MWLGGINRHGNHHMSALRGRGDTHRWLASCLRFTWYGKLYRIISHLANVIDSYWSLTGDISCNPRGSPCFICFITLYILLSYSIYVTYIYILYFFINIFSLALRCPACAKLCKRAFYMFRIVRSASQACSIVNIK